MAESPAVLPVAWRHPQSQASTSERASRDPEALWFSVRLTSTLGNSAAQIPLPRPAGLKLGQKQRYAIFCFLTELCSLSEYSVLSTARSRLTDMLLNTWLSCSSMLISHAAWQQFTLRRQVSDVVNCITFTLCRRWFSESLWFLLPLGFLACLGA